MEPEGILKACTTKVRMSRARARAMMIASAYSRNVDFFLISGFFSLHPPFHEFHHGGHGEHREYKFQKQKLNSKFMIAFPAVRY